jgi:hypothetical protein
MISSVSTNPLSAGAVATSPETVPIRFIPRGTRYAVDGRGVMVARRVIHGALALALAEAVYVAGFSGDPWLSRPVAVLAVCAIVAKTVLDYRADAGHRRLVLGLERSHAEEVRAADARYDRLRADFQRVSAGALETAAAPTVLSAQLLLLMPVLTDLLATPSASRREHLLAELELGVVRAAADLMAGWAPGSGGSRAVLYRKVRRHFEPAWLHGYWADEPRKAGRTSPEGREMARLLRQSQPAAWVDAAAGKRMGIRVPLHAGRRGVGVLCADRSGSALPGDGEREAAMVLAHVLMAGAIASRLAPAPTRPKAPPTDVPAADAAAAAMRPADGSTPAPKPSPPRRRRWKPDPRVSALVGVAAAVRGSVASRLERIADHKDSRAVVREALGRR